MLFSLYQSITQRIVYNQPMEINFKHRKDAAETLEIGHKTLIRKLAEYELGDQEEEK
jgi:DNA-binding NtrC family response regulator